MRAAAAARPTTRRSSSSVFGRRSSTRGASGSRRGAGVPAGEPRRDPQVPDHAVHGPVATGARLGLARLLRPAGAGRSTRRSTTRASSPTSARSPLDGGPVHQLADIKGPAIYTVTSLAYDPASRTLFYTTDNNAYRDLIALDPATGRKHTLIRRTRASAIWPSTAPTARSGASATSTASPRSCASRTPYTEWTAGPLLAVRRGRLRPRRLARRHAALGVVRRDQRPPERCVVLSTRVAADGRRESRDELRLRQRDPVELRLLARRRATSTAARTTRASRTSSATRSRRTTLEAVTNAETGFFRPIPLGGRRADRLPLHRPGLRARADRGAAARGRQPDHASSASRSSRSTRS